MAADFREFLKVLEKRGQLRRIKTLVDSDLEIAEISNRMLQCGGPGLLFENVKGAKYPVAVNIMGTVERICWAMNMEQPQELEDLGRKLAMLQQPKPPKKSRSSSRIWQGIIRCPQSQTQPRLLPTLPTDSC
jgi:4-hydroxy-3-polyprenylbenzoate decarboxylase